MTRVFVDFTARNHHDRVVEEMYRHFEPDTEICMAASWSRNGPLRQVAAHLKRIAAILRNDHVHFFAGKGFLPIPNRMTALEPLRYAGLRLLRALGKKVFVHFQGCDLRHFKPERPEVCGDCPLQHTYCAPKSVGRRRRALDGLGRSVDGLFVSTPDLFAFLPRTDAPVAWMPKTLPASTRDLIGKARAAAPGRDPADGLRFVHAPSKRKVKGTDQVLAAIEAAKAGGQAVSLELVEKASREELFRRAAECDVALDQFQIGFYGTFSVEMIALGLPVCVKLDLEMERILKDVAGTERLPMINSTEKGSLEGTLPWIVDDFDAIRDSFERNRHLFLDNIHSLNGSQFGKVMEIVRASDGPASASERR